MTIYHKTIIAGQTAQDVELVRNYFDANYGLIQRSLKTGISVSEIYRACARKLSISTDRVHAALEVIKSE